LLPFDFLVDVLDFLRLVNLFSITMASWLGYRAALKTRMLCELPLFSSVFS
jgi:hypothetical protein